MYFFRDPLPDNELPTYINRGNQIINLALAPVDSLNNVFHQLYIFQAMQVYKYQFQLIPEPAAKSLHMLAAPHRLYSWQLFYIIPANRFDLQHMSNSYQFHKCFPMIY